MKELFVTTDNDKMRLKNLSIRKILLKNHTAVLIGMCFFSESLKPYKAN